MFHCLLSIHPAGKVTPIRESCIHSTHPFATKINTKHSEDQWIKNPLCLSLFGTTKTCFGSLAESIIQYVFFAGVHEVGGQVQWMQQGSLMDTARYSRVDHSDLQQRTPDSSRNQSSKGISHVEATSFEGLPCHLPQARHHREHGLHGVRINDINQSLGSDPWA